LDKKKQVIETALLLIKEDQVGDLTIELLSQRSGLSEQEILDTFEGLATIIDEVIVRSWTEHYKCSEKIITTPHPLQNLLAHDIAFINSIHSFIIALDSKVILAQKGFKALDQAKRVMPRYYQKILDSRQYLMPETTQDSALYSRFITHSIFFLTKKNLNKVMHSDTSESEITRQIIESLFPRAVFAY
jgi:tRNA nucleotidyltransferase/poly(A) polymerase